MLPLKAMARNSLGAFGAELDVEAGRAAARLAVLNGLAVAATFGNARQSEADRPARSVSSHLGRCPRSAESRRRASELLQDIFGKDKNPSRLVYGVASLPLGVPVELELILRYPRMPPAGMRTGSQRNSGSTIPSFKSARRIVITKIDGSGLHFGAPRSFGAHGLAPEAIKDVIGDRCRQFL